MSNTSSTTITLVALSGIVQSVTCVMSKAGKPYLKGSILCGTVTKTVVALGKTDMAAIMGRMIPGQTIALVGGYEKGNVSKSFITVGLAQGGETAAAVPGVEKQTAAPAPAASNDNQAAQTHSKSAISH